MRWAITGTNRGIGIELVRQLIQRGDHVDAFVRKPEEASSLRELIASSSDRIRLFECDVASDRSVRVAANAVGDVPIDVLVNNAGVMGKMESLEEVDLDDAMRSFDVNALGAIRVTRALLPNLQRSQVRKVVSMTSGMGSIEDNDRGGAYGYRMSKAALNMATRSMSVDLADQRFICVVMNPGWVQTDMGGENAPTPVFESVRRMIAVIDALTPERSGTFVDYRGGTLRF